MYLDLPASAAETVEWPWDRWQPAFQTLIDLPLSAGNIHDWLSGWSQLSAMLMETFTRLNVATTRDTTDEAADRLYRAFLSGVFPQAMAAEQQLKQKLLASGIEPDGFAIALRDMRAEAALFREANLPLQSEDRRLGTEYNKIIGAQTVGWEGAERTITALTPVFQEPDRDRREQAWRLASARQLADRAAINELWTKMFALRLQIAANADKPDYRAYAWVQRGRFDYTPDDCMRFHEAIEAAAVPAAQRVYARRAATLGLDVLRPWDTEARPAHEAPLQPYTSIAEFIDGAERSLSKVDPQLGDYFRHMRGVDGLDLENRKGKAPGGYCATFAVEQRPFIFMNAVGVAGDVRTLLHEAGHAFHVYEARALPYIHQRGAPMEFSEVASMSMELLAAPYLRKADGGYYNEDDYRRACIAHLEGILLFWPYMAVVDGFQHWAYTNPQQGSDPASCDAAWDRLWSRFMPGVDWSGLDDERMTGWHRKQHIHRAPFYYVEYGLAQLGAVHVWRNSLSNQAAAVAAYRQALALGRTRTLPELFAAAGARFAFDTETMQRAVDLIEEQIEMLH